MNPIIANIFWNLVGVGPWFCGGLTFLFLMKTFSDGDRMTSKELLTTIAASIGVALLVGLVVGLVLKPMHKEKFPMKYYEAPELGPGPGGINYKGE